jgi:hypothetical protein
LKLQIVAVTANLEVLVATAALTTTSGAQPSILYEKLLLNPEKTADIVSRIEVQHGSIMEHNRLTWVLEAKEKEVLEILLKNRFFNFTRLTPEKWLVSGNIRTVMEYAASNKGELSIALIESIRSFAPHIYEHLRRNTN